jgi:hypothetical protein
LIELKQHIKRWIFGEDPKPTRVLVGLARGVWMNMERASHLRLICGLYEPAIRGFLTRELRSAQVCFDVGANAGFYSFLFASQPHVREVHAFEPNPRLLGEFRDNLELNPGLAPKIKIHETALGNGIAATALDRVMEEEKLPMPDIVKIDVDGPEAEILRGSRKLLAKRGTAWVVETHSAPLEAEVEKIFRDAGYKARFPQGPFWLSWFPEERLNLPNRHLVALPE